MRDALSFGHVKSFVEQAGYILLSTEYKNHNTRLEMVCPEGKHYSATWDRFRHGYRCRSCSAKVRALTQKQDFNFIKQYVEREGYVLLIDASGYIGNKVKMKMLCPNKHICYITWSMFTTTDTRCKICWEQRKGDTQRTHFDDIRSFVESCGYTLLSSSSEYKNVLSKIRVRCNEGHEYEVTWGNFKNRSSRCPTCFHKQSKAEREIVKVFANQNLVSRDRILIAPYELDIYFPDHKVAIEYCGLYWHCDQNDRITSNYHRKKLDLCNRQGIRLLTIFEDEWLNHKDICISRINSALGIVKNKVYARKCVVKQITNKEAYEFLDCTHMQGSGACKIAYGLFDNDKLIQVMTFGSPTRAHTAKGKRVLEMKRLASKLNTTVVGGASKLFKLGLQYAKDNNYDLIKSYCDLRWGTGNLYKQLGFIKTHETKYTPHYTDRYNRFRNQQLAQNKQKTGITEAESAAKKGLHKIYDCGHQTWQYNTI